MIRDNAVEVSDIVAFIGAAKTNIKDKHARITGFKPISVAREGDLAFISKASPEYLPLVLVSKATLVLVPTGLEKSLSKCKANLVFTDRPRLWFLRSVARYSKEDKVKGIHPTAIVESKDLSNVAYIGPGVWIGKGARIGERTIIWGGVQIYDHTSIGDDVEIKPGAVIGARGFGFERGEDDTLEKFPHIGGVIIEDHVEIGANTCVDRGTLSNTRIGFGSKIDNLVHIGHNAKIGRNCLIAAGSVICGSEIGDNCFVGVGARVKQKVRIGRNVVVGMGAVVLSDVPDNITVVGVPAHPVKSTRVQVAKP